MATSPARSPAAHRAHVLLDTNEPYDAWKTGRDGPEDYHDGQGLRVAYDGEGTIPSVTLNGPDGQIDLTGIAEIEAVAAALQQGCTLAEEFGDPIPFAEWVCRLRGDPSC